VYDDDTRDLDWSLRHVEGLELEERLGKFIESEEPRKIATDLLLASPGRLERALDLLSPGYFDDVRSPDREDRLLDKILWKLGFDVHGYQDYLPRFHERLTKFQESVDPSDAIAPETARDEIRGAGNNLFVSLEEVLDSAISFITWGLLFDHVAERRSGFDFNLADAREFTSDRLNAELAEETKRVPLDPSGKNTLDPLAAGFATLAELLEGLQDEEEALRRPTSDLPSWARYSTYEVFPFAHTVPWLDLTTESRNVIVDAVRSVPQVLSRNDVTRVRNQVAHRRDDFPTGNEVHRVTTALRELVNHLEDTGVLPNVYIREQRRTDLYGRALVTMRDYSGRTVQIAWPSEIGRTGVPSLAGPQTIITCSVISGTAEPLRFRIEEDSEYRRMWAKWPSELHRPEGDGAGERSQPPDSNTPDQVQESFDNTLEAA
jgi:hypothetical protein